MEGWVDDERNREEQSKMTDGESSGTEEKMRDGESSEASMNVKCQQTE
jgi:hypothetical protein